MRWPLPLLILLLVGVAGSGCRPPAGAPALAPGETDPDSLRAALARTPPVPGLEGRALVQLEVRDERHPVLDLRFAARRGGESRGLLRPGVLSPVLSFWASPAGWLLLLPRQRVAFAMEAQEAGDGPGEWGELAWYILAPRDLVPMVAAAEVVTTESGWVLRGRLGKTGLLAEVALDASRTGVARWSLQDRMGASLLRVAYDPPVASVRAGGRTDLLLPALEARAGVRWTDLTRRPVSSREPPEIPEGWESLPGEELPTYLETLLPPEE